MANSSGQPKSDHRFVRGSLSFLRSLVFPLGHWAGGNLRRLATPDRMEKGLVIVLPGIEGKSFVNIDLIRGLADGGVESAIELFDWTTGILSFLLYHLRGVTRNRQMAERIAASIVEYQDRYPGRPVQLVGHSGGTALAAFALEALPPGRRVTAAVLLASALSPHYDLGIAVSRTDRGIWNFISRLDLFFLGAGTLLFGTVDGRHCLAAGNRGFPGPPEDILFTPEPGSPLGDSLGAPWLVGDAGSFDENSSRPRLHQVPYRSSMLRSFHFGGHCGWTNRVFAAETIAPLIRRVESSMK